LYTVLDTFTKDGQFAVKMRNPWGSELYTGKYADKTNDGMFWMPAEHFLEAFPTYTIGYIDDYFTTIHDQKVNRGEENVKWEYYIDNPVAQTVFVSLDYGTPR